MKASKRQEILLDPTQSGRQGATLLQQMRARLIGQDDAITSIFEAYQLFTAGLSEPCRPICCRLLLGPTGCGKTRAIEALSESVHGTELAIIRIDCAEFQHSHEISRLIGSPPGYLGHRETHPIFTQEELNHKRGDKVGIVLFDEIDKASDALWKLLLAILDKATLTLGDNRKVDFSRTMIFMTANLGVKEMYAAREAGASRDDIHRAAVSAAHSHFSPEFINRLDGFTVFDPLSRESLQSIFALELSRLHARMDDRFDLRGLRLLIEPEMETFVIDDGYDPEYGARHLKRSIRRHLTLPLANLIASKQVIGGEQLMVRLTPGDAPEFWKQPATKAATQ